MDLSQLETLVWAWLDDVNGTYFLKSQVDQWLNNAQIEAQKQLIQSGQNWYQKCVETNTVSNVDGYALPSDFLKINHLSIITGNAGTGGNELKTVLKHSTQAESDVLNYTLSCPATFFLKQNNIYFRPYPDKAYLVRLDYDYLVTDMVNSTDVPDVPRQYHEYLAVLATIDGLLKDQRDPSPFILKKEQYEDRMKKDAQDRMVDKPREVVRTWDDGVGFLF